MKLIQKYYHTFNAYSENRAFCINNTDYSYSEFLEYINGSRKMLNKSITPDDSPIGIICFDAIETYAAIFAAWFCGKCFVPINPKHPLERNRAIIKNTGIRIVISAKVNVEDIIDIKQVQLLNNSGVKSTEEFIPVEREKNQRMYILTTSGSTGIPKYVPINLKNVEAYCSGFLQLFPELNSDACFLQTYDLTSDAAFTGYLLPLLVGACVYTLPDDQFKFLSIAKILSDKKVDWVKMTPSVLQYLKPYRDKLDLKHIRHFIFGGEALPLSMLKEWWPLFPSAKISNLYGPTETTISSTVFKMSKMEDIRSINGILSIGKPFPEVDCVIIDKRQNIVRKGIKGELCIAGKQTMNGYLNGGNDTFFTLDLDGIEKKYYRTGDLVQMDNDGFLHFLGRLDDQVKINGNRINLTEVENTIRNLIPGFQVAVVMKEKEQGIHRLYAFLEGFDGNVSTLIARLKEKLPVHMIPEDIIVVSSFPMATSGKTDRRKLVKDYL